MNGYLVRGLRVALITMVALLLVWAAVAIRPLVEDHVSETSTTTKEKKEDKSSCEAGYRQVASNNDKNRVIGDFSVRYAEAKAEANNLAEAQKKLLLEESGKDASVLAAWSHAFELYETPEKWKELVEGECLSPEGVKLHNKFDGALSAKGTSFKEAKAPANGKNSGVSNGGVYGASEKSGITGNRKAIKVTRADGSSTYIMVRCGNPVYTGNPGLPDVPTDEPLPRKDPKKDPWKQGNAPDGGGENADKGPGEKTKNPKKPGDKPRKNPPSPTPEPKPTPKPTTPPPPEPEAPKPDKPETKCTPIPGVEDCK